MGMVEFLGKDRVKDPERKRKIGRHELNLLKEIIGEEELEEMLYD